MTYKNSSRFFENTDCEYYPCHEMEGQMNCLFCYCPFYRMEKCPGSPQWLETKRGIIKNCTYCTFPHKPENYDKIMEKLREAGS